jgi:hypothetical protein
MHHGAKQETQDWANLKKNCRTKFYTRPSPAGEKKSCIYAIPLPSFGARVNPEFF